MKTNKNKIYSGKKLAVKKSNPNKIEGVKYFSGDPGLKEGDIWNGFTLTSKCKDGTTGVLAWRDENLNIVSMPTVNCPTVQIGALKPCDYTIWAGQVDARQTFATWEALKNPPPVKSEDELITEEQYFARKKEIEDKKLAEEAEKKRQEELRKPPYYHFKEMFPKMTWDVKRTQVEGDNYRDEVIACYYDGVKFDPPNTMGFDDDFTTICPHTDPDIMEWAYEHSDSLPFDYRRCVMIKEDMEHAIKWFKQDYPKIVAAYNEYQNKWYRRLWRAIYEENWKKLFKTEVLSQDKGIVI